MPEGISLVSVVANGGQGGAGGSANGADGGTGGAPAQVLTEIKVHPGDVLTIQSDRRAGSAGLRRVEQAAAEQVRMAEATVGTPTG